MKKIFLVVATLLGILLIVAGVYVFFLAPKPTTTNPTTQNPFGSSGLTSPGGGTVTVTPQIPLTLKDGTVSSVPDFTKTNQPSWASATSYQVAGSVDSSFVITYIPTDHKGGQAQFLVTLLQEPLGSVRKSAEDALRKTLQLSDSQLCGLDTYVAAGPGVSDTYNGVQLGLSFCPGATKLP